MSEILRLSRSPGSNDAEASHTAATALIPLIVRNARDLIAFLDVEGRRIYNSPSYAPLLGDPDKLVGSDSFADIHADDRERVRAVFRDTVRSGSGYRVEYRLIARDGSVRAVQSEGSVIRADDSRVVGVVVVGRDVTEERHAESQLDAALRRQTALADFSLYALRASDPAQVLERAARLAAEGLNVDFCTVLELEPDGNTLRVAAGHNWPQQRLGARLGAGEDVQARQALESYRQSGSKALEAPPPVVTEDLRADARFADTFRVRQMGVVSALCVAIPAGEQPYGTLSAHSRTRRRFERTETEFMQAVANVLSAALVNFKAQVALRHQTDRLRIAQRAARMIVLDWDIQADRLEFSDSPEWLRGPVPEDTGKYPLFKDQVHPADRARFLAARQRAIETLQPETPEFRVIRTDGEVLWVRSHQTMIAGADGRAARMIAALYDITERKAAEQALTDSEARFRSLTALSSDWYWEQDAELRFRSVSEVFFDRSRMSRKEVLGNRRWELPGASPLSTTWDAHRALLEARLPFRDFEYVRVADDGSRQFVSLSGEPVFDDEGRFTGYRGTARDTTESRRAEQELRARAEGDRALMQIGLIGLREQDPIALLQHTVQIVGQTLGVDLAKALELLPDGSGLKLVAGTGWRPGLLGHATVGADLDSQAGYTIHEYEAAKRSGIERFAPVIVADLEKERRFRGPALLREHGVVSGMSVVIPGAERPWGVLGVHSRTQRRFEQREAEFLQAAANVLSAALARCVTHSALQESEARFRALTELSSDWYWEQDEQFRFTYFSERHTAAARVGRATVGKTRWELGLEGVSAEQWAAHRAALERHEPFHDFEYQRTLRDGTTVWRSVSGAPIFDATGRFKGYHGVGKEITQRKRAEQARADSERRYRILFEAGPEAVYLFDHESLAILAVNPRMVELYGWSRDQLLSMTMLDLRPPEERAFVEKEVRSKTSGRYRRRRRHWRSNGEVFDAEITSRFVDYAGRSAEMVVISDVTARQRAEQVLREQRRLLARAQDLAGLGYWEYDPATGAMQGSRELRRMLDLGVDLPSQTAEWSLNLVHPEDREQVRAAVQKAIEQGSSYELEARVFAADGTPRNLVISGEAVKDDAGRVTKVIGSCLDITEQRERENALCEAADQLQALSRRLVEAQETERRRLATELHDRVGQNLTALGINLDILARRMSGLDADAERRLEDSHSLIVATTRCVAGVLDDLHPPMLDDLGLGPTLRWAAQDFSRRTEIPTKARVEGVERRIDRQNELALLRIVQEALTNVAKHAGARTVGITLVWQPEAVQLEIADDGAGFECSGPHGRMGLGIATMRERTIAARGQLDIDSAPGRGTRVRVLVPG
jgi:PAS domain S-box-containing protein